MIEEERLAAMKDVALSQLRPRCIQENGPVRTHRPDCRCLPENPLAQVVLDLLTENAELWRRLT